MNKRLINNIFQTISECNTYLEYALRNKNDQIVSVQFSNQGFFCIKQLQDLIYSNEIENIYFDSYYEYFLYFNQIFLENLGSKNSLNQEYEILKSKMIDFKENLNFMFKQDITASENMFYI